VERVLARLRCVSRKQGEVLYRDRLWRLAKIFVEKAFAMKISPSCLNQALMELGASLCSVAQPKCLICPLNQICRSFQRGTQLDYPPKKAPKVWISVEETVHCVLREGKVLVHQRKSPQWRAGLWDFLLEKPSCTYLRHFAEVKTRHVVTRHKIQRVTHIWKLSKKASFSKRKDWQWMSLEDRTLPTGAAFQKSVAVILRALSS
jgi:adenine-specific DNA glycosylase